MTNFDLSQKIFDFLKQASVETVVVCAGARNAPLVMALEKTNLKVIPFFEERSASFFALGSIKAHAKPVAIITTSGTAVAEILPAAIEACYQGLPLIIISADRPKNYRQSGAPQSIQQVGLFSDYVENVYDLDVQTKDFIFEWSFRKPIQFNVCFDEPLIDQASVEARSVPVKILENKKVFKTFKEIKVQNPLIIVGELDAPDIDLVQNFLIQTKTAVYAEALSQISRALKLKNQILRSSDALVKKVFREKIFDSVIRIGGVPTLRFWRDLEKEFLTVPVFNFSNLNYSGLARTSTMHDMNQLKDVLVAGSTQANQWIKSRDQDLQKQKLNLLQKYPFSEQACVRHLSEAIGDRPIYLGNSLPIREWDDFSVGPSESIYANRGANGIDGQISTYLGWSENLKSSYGLVGDLTAMYDLAALGLTAQLKENRRRLVIMNNFGGQIFQRVFKNKLFINQHQIQFQHWAKMWNWDYLVVTNQDDLKNLNGGGALNMVIEIQPDAQQTKLFWDEWDQLCQKI